MNQESEMQSAVALVFGLIVDAEAAPQYSKGDLFYLWALVGQSFLEKHWESIFGPKVHT